MSTKSKNKFLDRLLSLGQTWAMASDPAVMQASGYVSKPEGVKYEDSEGAQQLRDNLSVLSGTANTVVNMGLAGVGHALTSEAGAVAGGYVGSVSGDKIDQKIGTSYWSPVLGIAGSFIGGGVPYAANKYWNGLKTTWNSGKTVRPNYANWGGEFIDNAPHTIEANQYDYRLLDKALSSGKLKFGTPATYTAFHQALSPIREFKFPFNERWDVVHHGADPNSAFLTGRSPAKTGFLSKRPYTSTFEVSLEKPLIQTGEIHGATKNGMRNKIVKYARDNGADGVVFEGILDNQVPEPQQIIQLFDTGDYKFVGGPAKVEYYGPTMGKTTIVKRNPELYVDLDVLVKDIRTKVAKDLGLSAADPKVGSSPQYKNAVKNLILEFRTNNANAGKTLLGSQRLLLDNDVVLDNTPMLPDFKTFVERNAVRGFKESIPEQKLWYKSIIDVAPDVQIDNRYISEIKK